MSLAGTLESFHDAPALSQTRGAGKAVVDPDTELVSLIAGGDPNAARALMARHLPRVLSVSRRMLGSQSDAEDVAQEVFMRAWTHAAKWKPGQAKFETWLYRVSINLCYDRLRRRPAVALDEAMEIPDTAPDPAQDLQRKYVARQVDAALQSLPDRQREAIVLCHYEGLTNGIAAGIMGVSVEAVESLLARGKRGLRDRLQSIARDLLGSL